MASNNYNGSSITNNGVIFEDLLPSMAEKLGEEGFMDELWRGFRLLMDEKKGVITFESLKKNLCVLGMSDEEVRQMMNQGDVDRDGCINQMEFYVLMFRLSPGLMDASRRWLQLALPNNNGS